MNKTWTNKDIEILKKYYPTESNSFLEKKLNKKMTAIRTKAMRIGIKRKVPYNCGNNNGAWKGDKVGYKSLHQWVKNNKPKPKLCEDCNKEKPFDLANISGKYKRDIKDFKWVCRKCHMHQDNRIKNLKQFRSKNGK
jgi:hypothetical protein